MTKLPLAICGTALMVVAVLFAADSPRPGAQPKEGFVPNAKTAIKIAVAVWEPIYGEDHIAAEKPYQARLESNGVWIVEGSLPKGVELGGVALAEIAKADARILRVSHGR